MRPSISIPLALALFAGLTVAAITLESGTIGKSLVLGALFGIVLQRSRFTSIGHHRRRRLGLDFSDHELCRRRDDAEAISRSIIWALK
jgi:hypothetical protein